MTIPQDGRFHQRGVTFFGGLLLLLILGVFAMGLIRLMPAYTEYLSVSRALTGLSSGLAAGASVGDVRAALARRFEIDEVKHVSANDAVVEVDNTGTHVHLVYDARVSFIDPVQLVLHFDKTVMLRAGNGP